MTTTSRSATAIDTEWKELHDRLRSIAKRRVALEAEEATWLIEAEDTQLYRRLGYTTMVEYMERELYWGPHAANERLRVARELIELPLIAELFGDGELCFSAVRELTRVATPVTEEAFLRKAQGKTAHQVQQMVAGLKRGDEPDDRPDPRLVKKRVVIHGGDHSMTNLVLICFGCHQRLHDGHLRIIGLAPDLEFIWRRDDDVDSAMVTSPRWDWESVDRDDGRRHRDKPHSPLSLDSETDSREKSAGANALERFGEWA